jgi:protein-disulfide isomerase
MTEHVEAINDDDHVRGSKAPLLYVIEYGDYDCPHTRAAQAIVDRMMEEGDDIAWAFRPFPLRDIHPNADLIARIAEAAHRQGRFWPMHDHLMRHRAPIDESGLVADLTEIGVDMATLRRDLNDAAIAASIEHHIQRGRSSGVTSTPTFFFDGVRYAGHYDLAMLRAQLVEARRRSADSVS